MQVSAIKTDKVLPGVIDIYTLLATALPQLREDSVVAVTSKIVSLCENRVLPINSADKDTLVAQESDQYLPKSYSKYDYRLTITNNTLIPMAGIDSSNGNSNYVLWPKDPQESVNKIRHYLSKHYNLKNVGVVITDSTSQALRRGTSGIALAHSGFLGLRDYVGKLDLFGRPFGVSQASIISGLAAAAVLAMGEGAEQTPLCVMSDIPFVEFQQRDPSSTELDELYISVEEDLFGPFISSVDWQPGNRDRSDG